MSISAALDFKMGDYLPDSSLPWWSLLGVNNQYEMRGCFGKFAVFRDKACERDVVGKSVINPKEGEAQYWMHLHHLNLMPLMNVISLGEERDIFIMPLYSSTLRDAIDKPEFYNSEKAFDKKKVYVADILWGLDYLHQKRMCLMNLSEDNVWISLNSDRAVIGNFSNLTLQVQASLCNMHVSEIYRPPEFMEARQNVDVILAEIWVCGAMILHIFCGQFMYRYVVGSRQQPCKGVLKFKEELGLNIFQSVHPASHLPQNVEMGFRKFIDQFLQIDPWSRARAGCSVMDSFLHMAYKKGDKMNLKQDEAKLGHPVRSFNSSEFPQWCQFPEWPNESSFHKQFSNPFDGCRQNFPSPFQSPYNSPKYAHARYDLKEPFNSHERQKAAKFTQFSPTSNCTFSPQWESKDTAAPDTVKMEEQKPKFWNRIQSNQEIVDSLFVNENEGESKSDIQPKALNEKTSDEFVPTEFPGETHEVEDNPEGNVETENGADTTVDPLEEDQNISKDDYLANSIWTSDKLVQLYYGEAPHCTESKVPSIRENESLKDKATKAPVEKFVWTAQDRIALFCGDYELYENPRKGNTTKHCTLGEGTKGEGDSCHLPSTKSLEKPHFHTKKLLDMKAVKSKGKQVKFNYRMKQSSKLTRLMFWKKPAENPQFGLVDAWKYSDSSLVTNGSLDATDFFPMPQIPLPSLPKSKPKVNAHVLKENWRCLFFN